MFQTLFGKVIIKHQNSFTAPLGKGCGAPSLGPREDARKLAFCALCIISEYVGALLVLCEHIGSILSMLQHFKLSKSQILNKLDIFLTKYTFYVLNVLKLNTIWTTKYFFKDQNLNFSNTYFWDKSKHQTTKTPELQPCGKGLGDHTSGTTLGSLGLWAWAQGKSF